MTKMQQIRKNIGITQRELAEKSAVSIRMIQHYERGEFAFENIGVWAMIRIAMALKVPLYALLDGDAEKDAFEYYKSTIARAFNISDIDTECHP